MGIVSLSQGKTLLTTPGCLWQVHAQEFFSSTGGGAVSGSREAWENLIQPTHMCTHLRACVHVCMKAMERGPHTPIYFMY